MNVNVADQYYYLQICIAPDYILVPRQKQDDLIQGLEKAYKTFYPNGALDDVHYGSIVNDIHFKRITSLLDRSKGEIVDSIMQGRRNPERRQLEPVVVKNVKADDSLLEEYAVSLGVYILDNLHFRILGRYLGLYYP